MNDTVKAALESFKVFETFKTDPTTSTEVDNFGKSQVTFKQGDLAVTFVIVKDALAGVKGLVGKRGFIFKNQDKTMCVDKNELESLEDFKLGYIVSNFTDSDYVTTTASSFPELLELVKSKL